MAVYTGTFGGLTMGPDTDFEIMSVDGLFARDVFLTTPDLPRYHGGLVGASYHMPRALMLTLDVYGAPFSAAYTVNRRAVMKAFQPLVDSETAFVFTLPGETAKRIMCRPVRVAAPVDISAEFGLVQFLIELVASDPVIYDDAQSSASLTPFAPSAGLSYPVTYPTIYGSGGTGAGTVVTNAGD